MKRANGDLGARLVALRADFSALGARAAGAAQSLTATLPPPPTLLDEMTAARAAFAELRHAMVQEAGALSLEVDADHLQSLRDLEPVIAAIAAAEAQRARLAAWEDARRHAVGMLDRVLGLIHREDKSLPALTEAQDAARQLRAALDGPPPEALEEETAALPDAIRPYADLLAMVDGWNVLDDEQCAALQDTIAEAFGRPLALAALRGRIGRAGETPPPAPRRRTAARSQPAAPPVRVPAAPMAPAPPMVSPPPERIVGVVEPEITGDVARPPAEVADWGGLERIAAAAGEEPEPTAAGLETEGAEVQPGLDEELERLARASAPWWISARAGWQGLRDRGLGFADAAHDYLKLFPFMLAVPLQASSQYEGGRLAEAYGLLLAHIERGEPGFVQGALRRLGSQFARHNGPEPYPIGQELYLYLVAEARLYKTYPDFVREIVAHTVPRPGPWVQGGIVDGDEETRLFMRGEAPGSTEEQTRTLTERNDRLGPHVFRVTLAPLTARFFTLGLAGETLADPPNVEIKLLENDAPTDHAWLVTLPPLGKGKPSAPRKHRTGGTTLEELGPQLSGFWMAVFNADPRNDRVHELSVILRRKPPPLPPDPKPGARPSAAQFFKR